MINSNKDQIGIADLKFVHGPLVLENGVWYRLWSPESKSVCVLIHHSDSDFRKIMLEPVGAGWFGGFDEAGKPGDLYEFLLDDKVKVPDVASRFQPRGVRGPSQVMPPPREVIKNTQWRRGDFKDLIIYELHVGTFSDAGTFAGVIGHLNHLQDLGVNAIELMPISAFPGERNWGYDVVLHFAPAHCYGCPDDLRRLVEAAHSRGLAVIVDVVYNHVCGEPNHFLATSPSYFKKTGGNAWGSSFNFDGENSAPVRQYFKQNAAYWFKEFHVDGLRLDATHAIMDESPVHILREIADIAHESGGFVIAEDDRNEARLLRPPSENGLGLDAVWADDFHHVLKMMLKPEPVGHFKSYQGTNAEMVETLENGWLFRGQHFPQWNKPRGTECLDIRAEHFIFCISNHDQTGNRPLGERLNHLVPAETYRAAAMFFLLLPFTPMIFMGQEWAATTRFCFFSNHSGDFGSTVSKGRLNEFKAFGSEWPPEMLSSMPDPESASAFKESRLDWRESSTGNHAQIMELYRQCLRLRKHDPVLGLRERGHWKVWAAQNMIFCEYGWKTNSSRLLAARLAPDLETASTRVAIGGGWKKILSSGDLAFGGASEDSFFYEKEKLMLARPATILFAKD